MVDHVTRFSAAAVVKSKDRNEIIKHLFHTWISIFGALPKLFSDNGREFSNEDYNEICDSYNITIKKTAAESLFYNGLMEIGSSNETATKCNSCSAKFICQ